jgi:hypothetical protein
MDVDHDSTTADIAEVEPTSPLMTLSEIAAEIAADNSIPSSLRSQASLSVERVWIEENLPNHELLDALASGYAFLSKMLEDAHELVGVPYRTVIDDEDGRHDFPRHDLHAGRLPCMITSRSDRTATFTLQGQLAGGLSFDRRHIDLADAEKSLRKYKTAEVRLQTYPTNAIDMMPIYLAQAHAILRSGEEHGWFVFYFRGRHMVHQQILYARDRADKRTLAQEVAEFVAINSIDGVIDIGEAWFSGLEVGDDGAIVSPTDSPDRKEVLMIHAELATGEVRSVIIPFRRRRFGKPVIDDPIEGPSRDYFLEPTRTVWRLAATKRPKAGTEPDTDTDTEKSSAE